MNIVETGLSIPCPWDEKIIEDILNLRSESGIKIKEMYGTLSDHKIPHGRALEVTKEIKREDALRVKAMLDKAGITFAYLLNAPIQAESYDFLEEDLEWIIHEFRADSITASSIEIIQYIRSLYPDQKINISTIAGIRNVKDAEKFISLRPNKIVTHHDVCRSYKSMLELIEYTNTNKIELEIMVNESCLRNCKRRGDHYKTLAEGFGDDEFHKWCNTIKLSQPYQLVFANFIRPEDVKLYEKIGIHSFKVTGRSKPQGWLFEVVKAYLDRNYEGNLIRLLGIDPKLSAERWVYVDNKSLDGFIEKYPMDSDLETEKNYCEQYILNLYEEKSLKIQKEQIIPEIKDGLLRTRIEGSIYN